jgi:lipopolysaccharide export LptBFGC system permease protein LptF
LGGTGGAQLKFLNYNKIMSDQFHPPFTPEPNPLTQRKHRREVLWQITAPLVVGVLLVLAAGIGVVYAGASNTGPVDRWASVSIIWMIIPTMAITLIFLAVTVGLAYGLMRLNGLLPRYTRQLQDVFVVIEARFKRAADAAVEPVLRVRSASAGLRALRRK